MKPTKQEPEVVDPRAYEIDEPVDIDDDEPTKEELLESLRISLRQALNGETRPVREVLAEVRAMIDVDES